MSTMDGAENGKSNMGRDEGSNGAGHEKVEAMELSNQPDHSEHNKDNWGRRRAADSDDDDTSRKRKRRGSGQEKEEIGYKLKELITAVGEKSSSSLESNLESLSQVLETDLETYKTLIVDVLVTCISLMPSKLTIYSTLVGLLNAKKYNFGAELLERLVVDMNEKMIANKFESASYIAIFFSDLVNCRVLSLDSYVNFLEDCIEAASEPDVPQIRSDWFVYTVLHCLPWVGQELAEKKAEVLEAILLAIESYIRERKKEYVKMLQVWSHSTHEQEEYLDCFWAQICKLRADDWKEKFITRHYVSFDGTLADALQHNLPRLQFPPHTANSSYPLPTVIFRFFDYADCPDEGPILPGAHSIERFLVEEELRWILDQNRSSRKECATHLLDYSKHSLIPLNYVILEVIFSQLFRLPDAPSRPIFYGSLLIELCKTKSMPQVIAQAAELFYQRIDSMQIACVDRLIDWFSYHMSNFEYRWSWPDWKDCVEMDRLAPRHSFVREVLERCMRLSYHQRLIEFLPADFLKLIPEKPEIRYDLNDDEHPEHDLAVTFEKAFREKTSADRMIEILENINDQDKNFGLTVFVKVLLYLARKTFSHNFAALTRYYSTLKKWMGGSDEVQIAVLRTIYDVWQNNHQMMTVLVVKLLKMSLLDATAVVEWIFCEDMRIEFERLWTWEVLNAALEHVKGHVSQMSMALEKRKSKRDEDVVDAKTSDNGFDMEKNSSNKELDIEDTVYKETEYDELRDCLKNLLLDVLHKYIVVLTEHIINSEASGKTFEDHWFFYSIGRFRNIFLKHWRELFEIREFLDEELFKPSDIDRNVMAVYHQFVAIMM